MPARADEEELRRRREQLRLELFKVEAQLAAGRRPAPPERLRARPRPLRAVTLDALDDLRWPAYSRELMLFLRAFYGRAVTPTRFGTLGSDEIAAFTKRPFGEDAKTVGDGVRRSAPRPVWLCFCLTFDRGEAIKRLWARSDWPLERRIVAPTSGRIQHLQLTKRLAELALEAGETAADPMAMKIIVADHARDLPGITFRRGQFPLEQWRDTAARMLAELEPRDREARIKAAGELSRRSERFQLFGIPDVIQGPEGKPDSSRAAEHA